MFISSASLHVSIHCVPMAKRVARRNTLIALFVCVYTFVTLRALSLLRSVFAGILPLPTIRYKLLLLMRRR